MYSIIPVLGTTGVRLAEGVYIKVIYGSKVPSHSSELFSVYRVEETRLELACVAIGVTVWRCGSAVVRNDVLE